MFLGDCLIPSEISTLLAMRPNKSWARGSPKFIGDSLHEWGGWKKFLPKSFQERPMEAQLAYWARILASKKTAIRKISKCGILSTLDCFIATDTTASIIVPTVLQESVAALGLELRISFSTARSDT